MKGTNNLEYAIRKAKKYADTDLVFVIREYDEMTDTRYQIVSSYELDTMFYYVPMSDILYANDEGYLT